MSDKPLTEREMRFVDAFLGPAKGKVAAAVKSAGYKGNSKTLTNQGARLMAKEGIKREIAARRMEMTKSAIATAEEVAVRLSGIGMGIATERRIITGKEGDFIEVDVTMPGTTQVAALKALKEQMGYDAPTKTEVTGHVHADIALSVEADAALAAWLRYSRDPVIAARLAELEAET